MQYQYGGVENLYSRDVSAALGTVASMISVFAIYRIFKLACPLDDKPV
jgi:hypothetical protein